MLTFTQRDPLNSFRWDLYVEGVVATASPGQKLSLLQIKHQYLLEYFFGFITVCNLRN